MLKIAAPSASSYQTVRYGNIYDNLAEIYEFSVHTPWKKLSEQAKKVFLYGTEKKWTRMYFVHPNTGAMWTDHVQWRGVLHEAHIRYAEAKSESYRKKMQSIMREGFARNAMETALSLILRHALLNGKRIYELDRHDRQRVPPFF